MVSDDDTGPQDGWKGQRKGKHRVTYSSQASSSGAQAVMSPGDTMDGRGSGNGLGNTGKDTSSVLTMTA